MTFPNKPSESDGIQKESSVPATLNPDHDFEKKLHHSAKDVEASGECSSMEKTGSDIPDGGLTAWLVLFGSFCGSTTIFGIMDTFGAIEVYLAHNQLANEATSTVGWIFALFLIIAFVCIFLTGEIFDRLGARVPMLAGTVLLFLGLFTTGSCTKVYQFILAFSITTGLACAVSLAPVMGVLPQYFEKRLGVAAAISTIGASVGGSIFPVVLRKLYTLVGFVWGMRIFAFINTALMVLATIFLKARVLPQQDPEFSGKSLKGKLLRCLENSLELTAFKEPQFFVLTFATLLSEATIVIVVTYYASYAVTAGLSENTAYFLLTLINLVGIPARYVTGWLADHYGKFNIMILNIVGISICCFVILLPFGTHHGAFYAFAVVFGIVSCSVFTLTPVCLAQIIPAGKYGKRFATMYLVASMGNLLIPAAGAVIGNHDNLSGYRNYAIFCGVTSFTGAALWTLGRQLGAKKIFAVY